MEIYLTTAQLAKIIHPKLNDIDFAIHSNDLTLTAQDFELTSSTSADGQYRFRGRSGAYQVDWSFAPERDGFRVMVSVDTDQPFNIRRLDSLLVTYASGEALDEYRIPTLGLGVESIGMPQALQLNEVLGENPIQGVAGKPKYAEGSLIRGAFPNSRDPGLFLGTILPQKHKHYYSVERIQTDSLRFTASTYFLASYQPAQDPAGLYRYTSESTWISAALPIRQAITAYAEHLPGLPQNKPPVGWNSWDYYFSAVSQEDILENADFIRTDAILSQVIQYIVIDMGWEHCWGEWQSNYRFSDGLEHLANQIKARGFIPGIWTAPLIVHPLSYPGLRAGEIFIKNEHGDPWPSPEGGQYVVDPTHPSGQAFLREIFTRLHRAGYRLFKIDFVNALIDAPCFHDLSKGPYEALGDFFRLVRECVGPESHILGCSLPAECGPELADSHRTGIDIHNQWTHVEWALDFYQLAYWQSDRIAVNDPDFLVVRGRETSLEVETNVLNPNAHNPNPPRWRRGPVFNLNEARTWATFVSLAGGSVFLSDRLSMLNGTGVELVRKVIQDAAGSSNSSRVVPLDLADAQRPGLWYVERGRERRLGIINWSDEPVKRNVSFSEWGLPIPDSVTDFWTAESYPVVEGKVFVELAAHAIAYLVWEI